MTRFFEKLSARERVLLIATVSIIAAGAAFFGVQSALTNVSQLDVQMDQLEQTLIGLREMEARGLSIDEAFAQVAAHHSSAWTEQEIHDRLRLEIYRLAMLNPPSEDEPELVRVAGSGFQKLVNIPSLRQGTLREDREGYREYQLRIVIPDPTPIGNIVEFLRRLQESKHSLRIDAVELVRPPDGVAVTGRIDVTRTVVDSGPRVPVADLTEVGTSLVNAGFESWSVDGASAQGWQTERMRVERTNEVVTEGQWALRGTATEPNAIVYQTLELPAGRRYEVTADIAVDGAATYGAAAPDATILPGVQRLESDGVFYTYVGQFVAPGEAGSTVRLRVPMVVLEETGTTLRIDNVVLQEGET